MGCGVLVLALVLSICLPLMGMRSAEPENPILQAEPQEITVLQAGKAPGGAGSGDGAETSGSGANGDTESDLQGDVEQPDPNEADNEAGQDTEPETVPQDQPTQPDYSEASIGTNTDSNQCDEGEEAGDTGEADEDLPLAPLDLGAALTWYKYGSEPTSIVCAPGSTVGKRVLLAQLDNGYLPYSLDLTGLDAQDAAITKAYFAAGNAVPAEIDTRGAVPMTLPDGAEYQNYIFIVQATATQKNQKGETVKTNVQFTFLLQLESGIDLDLQLSWQTLTAPAQATCFANSSVSRTIKGDTIHDGLFQYDFSFLGESARDAEFISADYRATDGETGTLDQTGTFQMAPADGQDTETYSITVTARVSGQTIRYNFALTYEDGLDLQLQFTWYEKSVTAQTVLCDADKRVNLTVKHNQLQNGELLYKFGLKGKSANDAQILSATIDGTALNTEKGSYQLMASEGGATYTILVTAKVKEKNVTFTVTLRYQSDVSLQMTYTLTDPDTHASIPCSLTCESGKTVNADPIYDDQLTDGLLTYQFSIQGEDAENVTISSVKCYQTGSGRTETLSASGSVTLLLKDNKTGGNTFTVTAASGSESYVFTFDLPYKHRGEQTVEITTSHDAITTITAGTAEQPAVTNLTVDAVTRDAQGKVVSVIRATGTDTKMTVTLYLLSGPKGERTGSGGTVDWVSESGTTQHFTLMPVIPKHADGDDFYYELYIYAEDEHGNWNEKKIYLTAKRSEPGQKTGKTAQIYIDLSVLGLGRYGPVSYDILSAEPLSYVVAKVVLNQAVPAPFNKPCETFPAWTGRFAGSLDQGFYLTELDDGSNLVNRARALRKNSLNQEWDQFGSTPDEILAGIDSYFGAGEDLALLWRCLYRNGIRLNYADGALGEFDFTDASGWMYSLSDGSTFYPGQGLSDYYFTGSGRDVLTIRYTLACGWDVGGGGEKGNGGAGYCRTCVNGEWSGEHHYPATPDKNGNYVCASCGTAESCPHTTWEWKSIDDETHQKHCLSPTCDALFGTAEAHKITYTTDAETHTAVCSDCGYTAEPEAHRWGDAVSTATCTDPGTETRTCLVCGYVDTHDVGPKGHSTQGSWESNASGHWQKCRVCHQEIEGTFASHSWTRGSDLQDWYCSVCWSDHEDGKISATDNQDGLTHTISCSGCTQIGGIENHDTLGADGSCSACGYTKAPDIPEHDCAANLKDLHANDGSTHTGTCSICGKTVTAAHTLHYTPSDEHTHTATCSVCGYSVMQEHEMVGGSCSLCYYTSTPVGPPESTDPEGENTDE